MSPLNGQDGNGSGIVPPKTFGVLGDSDNGDGIIGTSNSGEGVFAESMGANGVHGVSVNRNSSGVLGECVNGGVGVTGKSTGGRLTPASHGVRGISGAESGMFPPHPAGVWGDAAAELGLCGTSNVVEGVYGVTKSPTHAAIAGINTSKPSNPPNNPGHGVYGETQCQSNGAAGVYGKSVYGYGVYGTVQSGGYGVYGESKGGTGVQGTSNIIGMWAEAGKFGDGLVAYGGATGLEADADNGGIAVFANVAPGPSFNSYAGYFLGPVYVSGSLDKAGGGFKIDHPLDPGKKYLSHSFVESSERKNIYDGTVVLNTRGEATVRLPSWFEALNRDFRYQLTAIGKPGPNLHVAQEISKGSFRISGGQPKMEVSWQITGVRKDPWAEAMKMVVEEPKPRKEAGFYLHPELYGKSEEKGVMWARRSYQMKRAKQSRSRRERSHG